MANEHAAQLPANPLINRVRDPQFRDVYANGSLVQLSPFDVTLIFMKNTDFAGQTVQVDQASVAMSPQHFKALVKSLNETLTAYEHSFGTLNIPDMDIQPTFNASQIEKNIQTSREAKKEAMEAMVSSTEKKPPSKQSRGVRKAKGS
jgi:Protein of unknown function (DUF3467)